MDKRGNIGYMALGLSPDSATNKNKLDCLE